MYPFIRYVESELLIATFHPGPEAEYKADHSLAEFKKWQIRRIHLALHLCRNIGANCALLIGWAAFERNVNWEALPEELQKGLRGFQVVAQHARTAAFVIRVRLRWRLLRMILLPSLPAPSFSTLAEHSNALIEFYGKAETLAEALSLGYGEEIHEKMLAVLGMVDLELDESET